jgi:hypothetical protein
VAVDSQGRVYGVGWDNRAQVFDKNGGYLASIGGNWGSQTSQIRYAASVAVDNAGCVYIGDDGNSRIQKFPPGYPRWLQTNLNGFGIRGNPVVTLAGYNDQLYAGTWDLGQVWRSPDGKHWSQFSPAWTMPSVLSMAVFKGDLYVGASSDSETDGGELWRTDGATWERVVLDGFLDSNNYGINALAEYSGYLYAATSNITTGVEVWRSASGDAGSWTQVNGDGFGLGATNQDIVLEILNGKLYLGLGRNDVAELYRYDGVTWETVFTNGLAANNTNVSAMEIFQGELYIGLRNVVTGGQVWRSADGMNWNPVFTDGLGDAKNSRPYGLIVFKQVLYLVFVDLVNGTDVWRSLDGVSWRRMSVDGWGDSTVTYTDYFDKGATVFKHSLYIGTLSGSVGGKIWKFLENVVLLPMTTRK